MRQTLIRDLSEPSNYSEYPKGCWIFAGLPTVLLLPRQPLRMQLMPSSPLPVELIEPPLNPLVSTLTPRFCAPVDVT